MTLTDLIKIKNRLNFNLNRGVSNKELHKKLVEDLNRTGIHYYGGVEFGGYTYNQNTCSGTETVTHKLSGGFAGVERVRHRGYSIGRLGFRMSYTQIKETIELVYNQDVKRYESEHNIHSLPSLMGYGRYDWHYGGLGIGVISMPSILLDENGSGIIPSVHLRLGPPLFHITAGYLDPTLPKAYPWSTHLGLGIFPRSIEGNGVIFGATSFGILPAYLLSGRINLAGGINIQPSLLFFEGGSVVSVKIGD